MIGRGRSAKSRWASSSRRHWARSAVSSPEQHLRAAGAQPERVTLGGGPVAGERFQLVIGDGLRGDRQLVEPV